MMGILPTGAVPQQANKPLSSVFWSMPTPHISGWLKDNSNRDIWLKSVEQRWPVAAEWLAQVVVSHQQWLPAHYRDVVLSRYGEGRIGIIGDAAHAMSPQLGQGVNMAYWMPGHWAKQLDRPVSGTKSGTIIISSA